MLSTFDRVLRLAGIVALAVVAGVFFFGTLRDRGQEAETREIACAVATWSGETVDYFDGLRGRLDKRIGTPEETSTDRAALVEVETLLGSASTLAAVVGRSCGPIIPRGAAR